jgi:hypothetical protein
MNKLNNANTDDEYQKKSTNIIDNFLNEVVLKLSNMQLYKSNDMDSKNIINNLINSDNIDKNNVINELNTYKTAIMNSTIQTFLNDLPFYSFDHEHFIANKENTGYTPTPFDKMTSGIYRAFEKPEKNQKRDAMEKYLIKLKYEYINDVKKCYEPVINIYSVMYKYTLLFNKKNNMTDDEYNEYDNFIVFYINNSIPFDYLNNINTLKYANIVPILLSKLYLTLDDIRTELNNRYKKNLEWSKNELKKNMGISQKNVMSFWDNFNRNFLYIDNCLNIIYMLNASILLNIRIYLLSFTHKLSTSNSNIKYIFARLGTGSSINNFNTDTILFDSNQIPSDDGIIKNQQYVVNKYNRNEYVLDIKNINNCIDDLLRYIIESFNKNNTTIVVFQDTVKKNIDEHYIIPKRTVMQDYGEYTQKLNNPTSSNETTPTLPIGGSKKHKKHKKTKKNKTKKNKTNLNKNISTSIGGSKKHNKTKKNKTKKL